MNSLFTGIKWIFFDVGFTLVDETKIWKERCREQNPLIRIGEALTPEELYERILTEAGEYRTGYNALMSSLGYIEYAPYRKEYEVLEEEAPEILKKLSGQYSLGIIANQSEGLEKRLEEWGIRRYFSVVVSSHEAGVSKPDPLIFEKALDMAHCPPGEAVMIGDRLDNDIMPAKRAGMKTVRILKGTCVRQRPADESCVPDAEIRELNELEDLLLPLS